MREETTMEELTAPTTIRIPPSAHDFAGFRRWSTSSWFPKKGRIDYLAGWIEVDMSPEDLFTHSAAKSEIAAELQMLITRADLGNVFIDRSRIASPLAQLSAEPDIVVVLWDTLDSERVRLVPKKRKPERFVELEGGPDVVVEILSDESVGKDLRRLPPLYAAAGVPELWLTDACRKKLRFEILTLAGSEYQKVEADAEGWIRSPRLGRTFRLLRTERRPGIWSYRLESK